MPEASGGLRGCTEEGLADQRKPWVFYMPWPCNGGSGQQGPRCGQKGGGCIPNTCWSGPAVHTNGGLKAGLEGEAAVHRETVHPESDTNCLEKWGQAPLAAI